MLLHEPHTRRLERAMVAVEVVCLEEEGHAATALMADRASLVLIGSARE